MVDRALTCRGTSECEHPIEASTSNSHHGQQPRAAYSPNVRAQSLPSGRQAEKALHRGVHVRGKWACAKCQTITQAPVAAHVIDKGIPTTGLLAQVLVAKYADHLPLYRQEAIFSRAGLAIPRSTLAQWVGTCGVQLQPLVDAMRSELLQNRVLHADETPVSMLKPATARRTGPTSGPTPRAPSRTPRWSSTTSANRARANMPGASWGTGEAASPVKTSVATRP